MEKQSFQIKGMARDTSPIKISDEFAYEIKNMRLITQDSTQAMSLTNEKGNLKLTLTSTILGTVIGQCVIGKYLVLFTHSNTLDYIYRLNYSSNANELTVLQLFSGDLGFGLEGVNIETQVSYENEDIQKVYWIDSVHQPRVINIASSETIRNTWTSESFNFNPKLDFNEDVNVTKAEYSGMFNAGTIQYFCTYYNHNGVQTAPFYQSPILYISPDERGGSADERVSNSFKVEIKNPSTNFEYVRIYSVFRSSENGTAVCKKVLDVKISDAIDVETGTLYYNIGSPTISTTDLNYSGVSLDQIYVGELTSAGYKANTTLEKYLISCSKGTRTYMIPSHYQVLFIGIKDTESSAKCYVMQEYSGTKAVNTTIEYYSTKHLSIIKNVSSDTIKTNSAEPTLVQESDTIKQLSIIDNGMIGETVDYSTILYAGGISIIPSAIAQKNNTLFFGNYKYSTINLTTAEIETLSNDATISFGYDINLIPNQKEVSYYVYNSDLQYDSSIITTFKGGEVYKFGIVLQDAFGEWSNVIPIGSATNDIYPTDSLSGHRNVKAFLRFSNSENVRNIFSRYKRIKVVISQSLNKVVCQGVLCPTVYNKNRKTNSPYAQSSWFFRAIYNNSTGSSDADLHDGFPQWVHNSNIKSFFDAENTPTTVSKVSEIQGASPTAINMYDDTPSSDADMFVDWNILTINSPDIEFENITQSDMASCYLRIVGVIPLGGNAISGNVTIDTSMKSSTGTLNYNQIITKCGDSLGYKCGLDEFAFYDSLYQSSWQQTMVYYPIYPWHRNGSLSSQTAPSGSDEWYSMLDTKCISTLRSSRYTAYGKNANFNIMECQLYNDDGKSLYLPKDSNNKDFLDLKLYQANIDTILTPSTLYGLYYKDSSEKITVSEYGGREAVSMKYKSRPHGVISLKYNSNFEQTILPNVLNYVPGRSIPPIPFWSSRESVLSTVWKNVNGVTVTANIDTSFKVIQPFIINQKNITDVVAAGESHATIVSIGTKLQYFIPLGSSASVYLDINGNIIEEGSFVRFIIQGVANGNLKSQILTTIWKCIGEKDLERYGSSAGGTYYYFTQVLGIKETNNNYTYSDGTYNMSEYNSTLDVPYLLYEQVKSTNGGITTISNYSVIATTSKMAFNYVGSGNSLGYAMTTPYLYIAELVRINNLQTSVDETTEWTIASTAQNLKSDYINTITANIGDTYYQRYDCLKTYPYSFEDQNQVAEVLSFMCETRVNIDGRYDKNRGLADNTAISNATFNLLNKAYTQNDNFISHSYIDVDTLVSKFPNQLLWTKSKTLGEYIDNWTSIVPTSVLDLDGDRGSINKLINWNDNLVCFQDKGVSQIQYNERVSVAASSGVPIELANSGKVDGYKYLSTEIGCTNKKTVRASQSGIYFIDSSTKDVYLFGDGIKSISRLHGFTSYFNSKDISSLSVWYDKILKNIYFIDNTECLCYDELTEQFISFFNYEGCSMINLEDSLLDIKGSDIYKQFAGNYNTFFGVLKEYGLSVRANKGTSEDLTFTNIGFKSDSFIGNTLQTNTFNQISASNEYQSSGRVNLVEGTNLYKKFRLWKADIPRNSGTRDRIRNPWALIGIYKNNPGTEKTVLHSLDVYSV